MQVNKWQRFKYPVDEDLLQVWLSPARNAQSGLPTPPGESAALHSNKKQRNTKNTGPEQFKLFYKQSVGDIEHKI